MSNLKSIPTKTEKSTLINFIAESLNQMPKSFEDFQAQSENYNDYQKTKVNLDTNLFVDDTPPEEICIFTPNSPS